MNPLLIFEAKQRLIIMSKNKILKGRFLVVGDNYHFFCNKNATFFNYTFDIRRIIMKENRIDGQTLSDGQCYINFQTEEAVYVEREEESYDPRDLKPCLGEALSFSLKYSVDQNPYNDPEEFFSEKIMEVMSFADFISHLYLEQENYHIQFQEKADGLLLVNTLRQNPDGSSVILEDFEGLEISSVEELKEMSEGDRSNWLYEDLIGLLSHQEAMELLEEHGYYFRDLFVLDHSVVRYSIQSFHDQWDSGQVGFIYTTDERLKEFGLSSSTPKEVVYTLLDAEIETFDNYVNGEVYQLNFFPFSDLDLSDLDLFYVEHIRMYESEIFSYSQGEMVYLGQYPCFESARDAVKCAIIYRDYPELSTMNLTDEGKYTVCQSIWLWEYTDEITYDEESMLLYAQNGETEFLTEAIEWAAGLLPTQDFKNLLGEMKCVKETKSTYENRADV